MPSNQTKHSPQAGTSSPPPKKYHFVFGSGPDLVLLHSGITSWHIWEPVLPLLAPHFRVIIIPLAGYPSGLPIPENEEVSLNLLVDYICTELDTLNIKSAHFSGVGLGSTLAIELAQRKRALTLTLFAPTGGWWRKDDLTQFNMLQNTLLKRLPLIKLTLFPFLFFPPLRRKLLQNFMINGDRVSSKDTKRLVNNMCTNLMPLKLLASLEATREFRQIPNPNIPILVVWPEKDRLYPPEKHSRLIMLTVPYADLKHLPGAGHIPTYDQPELVAEYIIQTTSTAPLKPTYGNKK